MNIAAVPFNARLGLQKSNDASRALVELDGSPELLNHLGTVHASAQFALAEACSGEFLIRRFADRASQYVPVVRRVEGKFKKPAQGKLFARGAVAAEDLAKFDADLASKNRALVAINVDVFDQQDVITLTATFEWFIQAVQQS